MWFVPSWLSEQFATADCPCFPYLIFPFYMLRDIDLFSMLWKWKVEMTHMLIFFFKCIVTTIDFLQLEGVRIEMFLLFFRICEICSSTASNVVVLGDPEFSDQWSETNNVAAVQAPPAETRRFWQGHRFLNFLLACMVFAFVLSWLFHFNVPG